MISIVIPVYNQADKLVECLESIKNQTYQNYEVVVIDDRSTDHLAPVLRKYKNELGLKFDYWYNQARHWAPYARNKGFKKTKGEFVMFCDADAVLAPDALEVMLKTLKEHPEASYVYPSHKYGHKLFRLWPFDAEKLKKMPYIHTTTLIRREHFPKAGWDENIRKLNDWDFYLSMLSEGSKGFWIDRVLFTIKPGGVYSNWLPSVFYKPFPFLPKVRKYNNALANVKKKHNL
ncbi:MAG: glycosyltransferase family A protein [Candidatus Falkowbacteria bacterium]